MKDSVGLVDLSDLIERMKADLPLGTERCAIVTIDCRRGNLDPEMATLPVPEAEVRRILGGTNRLTATASVAGASVVHVETIDEAALPRAHPFEQAMLKTKKSFTRHRQGRSSNHQSHESPGAELMPELDVRPEDYGVRSKHAFDMFYGNKPEIMLRSLDVDTLHLGGCNTNTGALASVYGAYVRDLKVVVLWDCVASAHGADLHDFALSNIQRRLGWVLTRDELDDKLGVSRSAPAAPP